MLHPSRQRAVFKVCRDRPSRLEDGLLTLRTPQRLPRFEGLEMNVFGLGDPSMMIGRLVGQAPTVLLWLIATLLALRNLRDRPRECWTVLALVGLEGFANFALPTFTSLAMNLNGGLQPGGEGAWAFWILMTMPFSIVNAIQWGLILWLVFGGPAKSTSRYLEEDPNP